MKEVLKVPESPKQFGPPSIVSVLSGFACNRNGMIMKQIELELNWIDTYFFQYFFHLRFDIFIGFFNFQEGRSFKGVLAVEKFGVQRNFLFPADAELLRKIL